MSGRPLSSKVARFAVVGVANSLIDLAAFAALIAATLPPLVANLLAWLVAVSFSYVANSRWSFARGPAHSSRSIVAFFSTSALIALGVSSGAILVLAGVIGVFPAKFLGICIAAALSFLAARWSIETLSLPRREPSPPDSGRRPCSPSATDHPLPPVPER